MIYGLESILIGDIWIETIANSNITGHCEVKIKTSKTKLFMIEFQSKTVTKQMISNSLGPKS